VTARPSPAAIPSLVRLDWPPTVNHYYTVARGRKILSHKGRQYKKDQAWQMAAQQIPKASQGDKYTVHIEASPPDRRKRDLDNLLKPVLDSLCEYGAITDDSHVDELLIRRCEVITGGMIEVSIWRNE
jgi:crossover junction endodeoxyribonuclease RusA